MIYDIKPETIGRLKLNNLTKGPPSKTIFLETAQQTKPIPILANNIREKEMMITFMPNPWIFFLKRKNSIRKVFMPDIEVARASPLNFRGNIRIEFKIIFTSKAINDTCVGVTVSFKAKKQDCKILVAP